MLKIRLNEDNQPETRSLKELEAGLKIKQRLERV